MTVERDEGFRAGELLPCPFCGNSNLELYRPALGRVWYVHCEDCEIFGAGAVDRETAALKWNARALLSANAGQPDSGVTVADLRTPSDWVNSISGVKATDQFIALDRRLLEDCVARALAASAPAAREGE